MQMIRTKRRLSFYLLAKSFEDILMILARLLCMQNIYMGHTEMANSTWKNQISSEFST